LAQLPLTVGIATPPGGELPDHREAELGITDRVEPGVDHVEPAHDSGRIDEIEGSVIASSGPAIGFLATYFNRALGQIAPMNVGGVPEVISQIRTLAKQFDNSVISEDDLTRASEAMIHEFGSHFGQAGRQWTFKAEHQGQHGVTKTTPMDVTIRADVGDLVERIEDEEKLYRADLACETRLGWVR
jgi:hypothetical protein